MPTHDLYSTPRRKTWKTMHNWERKRWYRDNATAIALGHKPLRKP